jgi:hypothetical protein
MAEMQDIPDMELALGGRLLPTITLWNRLEGRPRLADFDRALRAEVRDALWMLSRQWQMGEFLADDAGSPIFAKIRMATTGFTKYQADARDPRPFATDVPLEAQVEARPIPFQIGDQYVSLDLRLLMGRHWLKLVRAAIGDFDDDFVTGYRIEEPDPDDPDDAQIVAHPEAWQDVAAVAGRMMDGYELYRYLVDDPGHHAYDGTSIDPGDQLTVDELAARFVAWVEELFHQPGPAGGSDDAWKPAQLEYQFACSAPVTGGARVYVAEEYYHGRLDWYNLDIDPSRQDLAIPGDPPLPDPVAETTSSFIPVQLTYGGMPNTRWWAFEDRKTNFGDVRPDTTDLAKLLLLEFGLVYANDWFVIPHALAPGSIATVRGMAVTNVFGERFWIEPAGSGQDDDWQRWTMFTTSVRGEGPAPASTALVLLPSVPKIQEGRPLEEVRLIRDEMANMVWGVETRVPLPTGVSRPGEEAGRETLAFYRRLLQQAIDTGTVQPPADDPKAPIRYQVMSAVPENWIPLIPVHVEGDNREIQLQRAAMPRILEGDPNPTPAKVHPRTVLLREGLDRTPRERYFLHEEEVPRTGVTVTQSFQRTRWYGGKVVTWLGVRKQIAPPTGGSGLRFDYLKTTQPGTGA